MSFLLSTKDRNNEREVGHTSSYAERNDTGVTERAEVSKQSGKSVVQKLSNDHFIHRNCCPLQSQVSESWKFGQDRNKPNKSSEPVKVKKVKMKCKTLAAEYTFRLTPLKLEKTSGNSAKPFLSPTLFCKHSSIHRAAQFSPSGQSCNVRPLFDGSVWGGPSCEQGSQHPYGKSRSEFIFALMIWKASDTTRIFYVILPVSGRTSAVKWKQKIFKGW